jgi:hypothetical protein
MLKAALVIQEEHQLFALLKALAFVKYHCQDDECGQLAASPIINQLLVDIKLALRPALEQKGIVEEARLEWGLIEDYPQAIDTIKVHLVNIEHWPELSESTQRKVIEEFISPMTSQRETAEQLLQWRNMVSS